MCIVLCCGKVPIKTLLIVFNLTLLLGGLLMLVFGIVAMAKPEYIFNILGEIAEFSKSPDAFVLGAIIAATGIPMIVLGIVVAAIGFLGCFGFFCKKPALLITYSVVLVAVICAELGLIIFAAVAPEKVKEIIQHGMQKSMSDFKEDVTFENDVLKMPNETVSLGWTLLQFEMSCCGTYNYTDYRNWPHNVMINGTIRSAAVPISCCAKNKNFSLASSERYDKPNFTNLNGCLDGTYAFINQKNCYDIIIQSKAKSIGIVVGILGEQLLLIILAAILCRQYRKGQDNDAKANTLTAIVQELQNFDSTSME